MNTKSLLGCLVILVVILVGIHLVYGKDAFSSMHDSSATVPTQNGETTPTSRMRVEANAIVVTEQRPGNTVLVSQAYLAMPGYVVIHEDKNGEPGAILGSSALLNSGANNNISVNLSRATRDGERLHAMLHADTDGNTVFSTADQPVESRLGGPISGWFDISVNAQEGAPITI